MNVFSGKSITFLIFFEEISNPAGMLDNEIMEKAFKMGVKEFLKKPYLAVELSMKIKTALEDNN